MISNIITYLFIGTCWVLFLDISAHYTNTEHRLTPLEKIVSALVWPITVAVFVYHFIKTIGNGQ